MYVLCFWCLCIWSESKHLLFVFFFLGSKNAFRQAKLDSTQWGCVRQIAGQVGIGKSCDRNQICHWICFWYVIWLNFFIFNFIFFFYFMFFLNYMMCFLNKKVVSCVAAMTLVYLNFEYMLICDQNLRLLSYGFVFFYIFVYDSCDKYCKKYKKQH